MVRKTPEDRLPPEPRNYALQEVEPLSDYELGRAFVGRWYLPETLSPERATPVWYEDIGATLRILAAHSPKSQSRYSVFDRGHLRWHPFDAFRSMIDGMYDTIRSAVDPQTLRFAPGQSVPLREHDFLVTTPLAQAKAHGSEARERIEEYRSHGTIGHYFRSFHANYPPKILRVGSKFFYVDNRAIRGFAVVSDFVVDIRFNLLALMHADTWRWIHQISVDYQKLKPPQCYAYITGHAYTKDIEQVDVIGGWLDPMPGDAR